MDADVGVELSLGGGRLLVGGLLVTDGALVVGGALVDGGAVVVGRVGGAVDVGWFGAVDVIAAETDPFDLLDADSDDAVRLEPPWCREPPEPRKILLTTGTAAPGDRR